MNYPDSLVATVLSDWSQAIEEAMGHGQYELAAELAQVVLRRLPRHLATYQRLIEITWYLKRWDEGEDWGRRLLQADPANPYAWRSLGRAAEQRDLREQAHALYLRAFEVHPFDPHVRAGLSRTGLDAERNPELNLACLGMFYIRGRRWQLAADTFRALVQAEPRRIDFQALLALTLWQSRAHREAYRLARRLTQAQPHLLLAWIVLDALGSEQDRALARHPLSSMDPDGEYTSMLYELPLGDEYGAEQGTGWPAASVRLGVTQAEADIRMNLIRFGGQSVKS